MDTFQASVLGVADSILTYKHIAKRSNIERPPTHPKYVVKGKHIQYSSCLNHRHVPKYTNLHIGTANTNPCGLNKNDILLS